MHAAGGVVLNHKNELLMILRNAKWDLPKGKVEDGENWQACAIREVEEECGVYDLKIVKSLPTTYHIYCQNGQEILKHTHWFLMNTEFMGKPTPQKEEGITLCNWIKQGQIAEKLQNSYGNIVLLLSEL